MGSVCAWDFFFLLSSAKTNFYHGTGYGAREQVEL